MGRRRKKNKLIYKIALIIIIAIVTLFGLDYANIIDLEKITNKAQDWYSNVGNYVGAEFTSAENTQKTSNLQTDIVEGKNVVVHFIDVGQGDSILVQSNGQNMLIDAGTNETGSRVVEYLNKLNVAKIDYLVGTHPHEDHIGGLDDVIDNFDIGIIYMPKIQTNTKTFESVLDSVANKNLSITSPKVGDVFEIGNAKCEIMACGTGTTKEKSNLNLSSIVIRMVYGAQSFLFTGDMEQQTEEARTWPETTVLKVGHHGSDTSSSEIFLNQINPKIAVISVGQGNSYGHPKQVVIDRLNSLNANIYRTDLSGTIVIMCDGNKCEVQ